MVITKAEEKGFGFGLSRVEPSFGQGTEGKCMERSQWQRIKIEGMNTFRMREKHERNRSSQQLVKSSPCLIPFNPGRRAHTIHIHCTDRTTATASSSNQLSLQPTITDIYSHARPERQLFYRAEGKPQWKTPRHLSTPGWKWKSTFSRSQELLPAPTFFRLVEHTLESIT